MFPWYSRSTGLSVIGLLIVCFRAPGQESSRPTPAAPTASISHLDNLPSSIAAASSFRALSACEATDLLVDLPSDELKVAGRVAPSEVVHPPSDPRIDDAVHHLDYRPV